MKKAYIAPDTMTIKTLIEGLLTINTGDVSDVVGSERGDGDGKFIVKNPTDPSEEPDPDAKGWNPFGGFGWDD